MNHFIETNIFLRIQTPKRTIKHSEIHKKVTKISKITKITQQITICNYQLNSKMIGDITCAIAAKRSQDRKFRQKQQAQKQQKPLEYYSIKNEKMLLANNVDALKLGSQELDHENDSQAGRGCLQNLTPSTGQNFEMMTSKFHDFKIANVFGYAKTLTVAAPHAAIEPMPSIMNQTQKQTDLSQPVTKFSNLASKTSDPPIIAENTAATYATHAPVEPKSASSALKHNISAEINSTSDVANNFWNAPVNSVKSHLSFGEN